MWTHLPARYLLETPSRGSPTNISTSTTTFHDHTAHQTNGRTAGTNVGGSGGQLQQHCHGSIGTTPRDDDHQPPPPQNTTITVVVHVATATRHSRTCMLRLLSTRTLVRMEYLLATTTERHDDDEVVDEGDHHHRH